MINGNKRIDILGLQYPIFYKIFGEVISLNKRYTNPLRKNDKGADCWFFQYPDGVIYFEDPADKDYSGDAKKLAQLAGLDDLDSLKKEYKNIDFPKPVIGKPRKSVEIRVSTRIHPSDEFVSFFARGGVDILARDNYLYKVKDVYQLRVKGHTTQPSSLCICYTFPSGRKQIYNPFKKKDNGKWISNTSQGDMWGYDPQDPREAIITSSVKDALVLEELGYNALSPRSESAEIPWDVLQYLKAKQNKVIVVYDNDTAGRKYASKLEEKHGFVPVFMNEKDPFDQASKEGIKSVKELLNV